MNLFNLSKVTNRIVVVVLVVISLIVISMTILLAFVLTKINLEKELSTLENRNLELYYKTNYIIKSLQSRLNIANKQVEFNYQRYKNGIISKDVFLQNISTNLLINAPSFDFGYGIGYWFEPFKIDSSKYFGIYSVKKGDSSYITKEYNNPSYDYLSQVWYTNVVPIDWNRNLHLNSKYYWSELFLDSGYSNLKMITLGIPIYDENKSIVGITTFDLTESDFQSIFSEFESNYEVKIFLSKKHSKKNIYTNDTIFYKSIRNDLYNFISTRQESVIARHKIKIKNDDYYIFKSIVQDQFTITLVIPESYLNSAIFSQISIIAGFAFLIISMIIFGFVYSYRVIIEQSLTNEKLNSFYKRLIEKSPNVIIIFDGKGQLLEYNERFKNIYDKYSTNNFDLTFFLKIFIGENTSFDINTFNYEKLNNYKFYSDILKNHYLLNCFNIEIEKELSTVFILTDISELIFREKEIKELNKNLEKTIAKRTEQLEGAMSSLQDLNRKLSINMENLTKVNNELSQSERKLKNTIETKDKFFSVITHDIKNPLHSIKMIIELLKNYFNMMKEDEIKSYYGKIAKTIDSVNSLIENVLLWSKSQSNLINFEPEIFDLSQSVSNIIKLLDSATSQKNIIVKQPISKELIVKTDKNMFEVVMRNLLSNAIKFSHKNSFIDIDIEEAAVKDKLVISIRDYGIGMNEIIIDSLFLNQNKVAKQGTDGEKGTGIGLALSKNFIDLMKEEIWVESSPNNGAKFSFTINKLV